MSLLQQFEQHIALQGCGPRTIRAYRRDIQQLFEFIGHNDVTQITSENLWQWDARVAHECKHNTRVRKRVSIRGFLQFIRAQYPAQTVPAETLPLIAPNISDPFILHPDDLKNILLHCREKCDDKCKSPCKTNHDREARDAAMIALFATTGIRREELAPLRMRDIELSTDGKNFIATVRTLKQGTERPQDVIRRVNFGNIEFPGDIATAHFGFWFIERWRVLGCQFSPAKRALPLFSALDNKQSFLHPSSIYTIVKRACERTGLIRLAKVTPHTFRHFYATHCIVNGMDVRVLQGYLGHSSIEQTYYYVHLADKATGKQAREHGPTMTIKAKDSLILPVTDIRRIFTSTMPRAT